MGWHGRLIMALGPAARAKEAGTGEPGYQLEGVGAVRALGTAPGGDRRDAFRGQARPMRPAGGMGRAGGEPGRRAGRAAGYALVLGRSREGPRRGRRRLVDRQRDPQPLADRRARSGRPARRPARRRACRRRRRRPGPRAGSLAGKAAVWPSPPVVTGDLNAEPGSDELRLLGGLLTAPAVPGLVLIDAWRYADPGDPGFTWDHRNGYQAGSGLPDSRNDYVLGGLPRSAGGKGR